VDIVMNEFRLWLGLFRYFGFSEEDARKYFFYRRFFHGKDKETQDIEIKETIARIEANQGLMKVLSALHEVELGDFNEVSVDALNILPAEIAETLKPYYQTLAWLQDSSNVSNITFDINEFHSSEFFHGLGYKLVLEGDASHIADGGSYHSYGRVFSERIRTVYSGVFRHEDLLMHDDKVEAQTEVIGVYMLNKGTEAKSLLDAIRAAGYPVFEDATSRKTSQSANNFKDKGIRKFAIIGDDELTSREVKVRSIDTGEYTIIKI